MPRGDKTSYVDKRRRAEQIEEGCECHIVPEGEAERRASATVDKQTRGGKAVAMPPRSPRYASANKATAVETGTTPTDDAWIHELDAEAAYIDETWLKELRLRFVMTVSRRRKEVRPIASTKSPAS
jgi:hypothetical protein